MSLFWDHRASWGYLYGSERKFSSQTSKLRTSVHGQSVFTPSSFLPAKNNTFVSEICQNMFSNISEILATTDIVVFFENVDCSVKYDNLDL